MNTNQKSDIQLGLEHQTAQVVKELESIRNHIFFKLQNPLASDREVLTEFENKILNALNSLENEVAL